MATLFGDPNLSVAASYSALGVGPAQSLRIMRRRPDEVASFGSSRNVVDTQVIDVRVADVAEVERGDVFTIDGIGWRVTGQPMRDRERLIWRCELGRAV
jgi:hypothetical protein